MAVEKWRRYESLMIFDSELGSEAIEELVQRAKGFIGQDTGRMLKTERWGNREMAFEVKGRRKGYYLLLEFAGLPQVASELDRRLNLIDTVLKFQTILLQDGVDPATLPEEEVDVVSEEEPAPAEKPDRPVRSVKDDSDDDDSADDDSDEDDSDDDDSADDDSEDKDDD